MPYGGKEGVACVGSVFSILIILFAMLAFWLGLHFFDSFLVAALLLLASILISRSLQPIFMVQWYKFQQKHFPLPPVNTLEQKRFPESGMVDDVPANKLGMRVLAMTEDLDGGTCQHAYYEMIEASLDALDQKSDLFRIRHEAVERRGSPVEYLWSLCGKDGELINKCFKAWLRSPNVAEMRARKQNRDMFLHDGTVTLKSGREIRYTVLVLFDGTLPQTIPQKQAVSPQNGEAVSVPAVTDAAGEDAAADKA